jgi:xylitol oxidase
MTNPKYKHIKAHGTNHTFNNLGDTVEGGVFVSLSKFKDVVVGENSVKFGAGITYSELIKPVDAAGKALPNLPSLPHINVVGSMMTATHGSGYHEPIMTAHVLSIDVVFADGSTRTINKGEDPDFFLYIINFGSVCIITSMTIKVLPTFKVYKSIY